MSNVRELPEINGLKRRIETNPQLVRLMMFLETTYLRDRMERSEDVDGHPTTGLIFDSRVYEKDSSAHRCMRTGFFRIHNTDDVLIVEREIAEIRRL